MKKLQSNDVQATITEVVYKALAVLDREFPGKNNGGINDMIAFGIHKYIEQKLVEQKLVEEE